MYSYEQRMVAVNLYIQYDHRIAPVIRELGYPNRHVLVKWYKEYQSKGTLQRRLQRKSKFTEEQKQTALRYYQEHGCRITGTIKKLGYPGKTTFKEWLHL